MQKQLYIDGFQNVHFINGCIKIETYVLTPKTEGDPVVEQGETIIMSPQVFLQTLRTMEQLADKFVEAGVFKKN